MSKYIFSHDHKTISKQFLVTAVFMACVAVMMSILFRLQLAWLEDDSPSPTSSWATNGPSKVLNPNMYLALVTIHGTIMVFFVLTGGLSGTFSNRPSLAGGRPRHGPLGFINMLSYWFFFLSSVLMLASLFVEGGPASSG